jgi:FAD binding domain
MMIETDVLIVGGSLVGLSAATFLAWHGVPTLSIERHLSNPEFATAHDCRSCRLDTKGVLMHLVCWRDMLHVLWRIASEFCFIQMMSDGPSAYRKLSSRPFCCSMSAALMTSRLSSAPPSLSRS